MEIVKQICKSIISALMTEKFVKEMVVFLLEKLAAKSDNKVDDEVVKMIKDALK